MWPMRDEVRYRFETEFVRSLIFELTGGGWDLLSLHRLLNESWLQRFQAHQQALAPLLFKSHACASGYTANVPTLIHLIKLSNSADVGTPVLAWHGTTAKGQRNRQTAAWSAGASVPHRC